MSYTVHVQSCWSRSTELNATMWQGQHIKADYGHEYDLNIQTFRRGIGMRISG